ncbi:uncharacterized protein LOC6573659 isoform X3 [Drosophila mojavensis]|uniref:Uncharacterized protein, isoform C n=1 Tax=Drosophila mojavensis TaxID=7230 RepID=A0A0Q9X9Y2_DROMO|nr:uncharacterized protein LOC6573659 isoform X3 [Drosophila mojavensis]KRG01438.1 uncharacterized protein Dmoj_GI22914, isoform C [Drosophila mojavensis]
MFPNYCFAKVPNDYGYDLLYMPKNAYNGNRQRVDSRPLRHRGKVTDDGFLAQQALQDRHNERLRRLHVLKPQPRSAGRSVEFRLPPMDQQLPRDRAHAGSIEIDDREYGKRQQQGPPQPQGAPPARNLPDLSRGPSETSSDFFNILYDNVLNAVHSAVEHMVTKHFAHIVTRMDEIASDLTQQETLMKQHNNDVMGKIVEQNESSLNQFKFVAQMLIDNQTLFYRALNNQRQSKRKLCTDDLTDESKCYSVECAQRLLDEYDQREESDTAVQRPKSTCKNCSHKSSRSGNSSCSRPIAVQRTGKGISTTSMPDLHRSPLFPSSRTLSCKSSKHSSQRLVTPTMWTPLGTGPRGSQASPSSATGSSRKCRCQVNPSAPVTQATSSVGSKRKLRSYGKSLPSLDDERSQK